MRKREEENTYSPQKRFKNCLETTNCKERGSNIDNILQFCSSLNAKFKITKGGKEITNEDLPNFIQILKTQIIIPGNNNNGGNDLYILHYLASKKKEAEKNVGFTEYFINNGGEVNQKDNGQHTPLVYAVIKRNKVFFKLLIDSKADVNSQNIHGNSVLHNAIKQQKDCGEYIEKLITAGADMMVVNEENKTPLDYAFDLRNTKALDYLIYHGAEVTNYIKKDICTNPSKNEKYKYCQEWSFWAICAGKLLTSDGEFTEEEKRNYSSYEKLVAQNCNLIALLARLIIKHSPEETRDEKLENLEKNLESALWTKPFMEQEEPYPSFLLNIYVAGSNKNDSSDEFF